jgi:uncharacterized protein (TIGR02001 family)
LRRSFANILATALLLFPASPAAAQVGAAISLFSDDRFRGYSLSEGRPVAIADLSYDAPNGIYGAASGTLVATREGIRPLGVQVNGGYAKRLPSGLSVDVGALHATYSSYSGLVWRSYTEVYAGIAGKLVSSRVSVSPAYFGSGWTVHGEVTAGYSLSRNLNIAADLGLLVPAGSHGYREQSHPVYDARVAIDRTFGRVSVHAAFTSRGAAREFYGRRSSRNALIVGISCSL